MTQTQKKSGLFHARNRSRMNSSLLNSPLFYQKKEETKMTKRIDFTAAAIYIMMGFMFCRMFLFVVGIDL